jgi:hypothetical protein
LIYAFFIASTFSGTQLGHKTKPWCIRKVTQPRKRRGDYFCLFLMHENYTKTNDLGISYRVVTPHTSESADNSNI